MVKKKNNIIYIVIFSCITMMIALKVTSAGFNVGMVNAARKTVKGLDNKVAEKAAEDDILDKYTQFIEDPKEDWILSSEAPPEIIPFSPVDLRKLCFGFDEEYFYFLIIVDGEIPDESETIQGNELTDMTASLVINTDGDNTTGWVFGDPVQGYDLHIKFQINFETDQFAYASKLISDGVHAEETRYDEEEFQGGYGYKFLGIKVPKSRFTEFGLTQYTCSFWIEAESKQYHHFAFDTIDPDTFTLRLE